MANITRFGVLGLRNSRILSFCPRSRRFISTSGKNNETVSVTTSEKVEKTAVEEKNWMSYGFDHKSRADDRNAMHSSFFFSVTLCIVLGTFVFAYAPDPALHNWAQREAFLELRRREQLGLPLIDKNLVDAEKIVLPSNEELNEIELII